MIGNIAAGLYGTGVAPVLSSYESIMTADVVSSGGSAYIDFTSIPSTYKHLQIRASYNNTGGATNLYMTLNGSTGSSYYHYLFGDGSGSATAGSTASDIFTIQWGSSATTQYAMVLDILDYGSTSKNKTIRTLAGVDYNGSGGVFLSSNLYSTTSAISSIRIGGAYNLAQYSKFALYGIKD